MTLDAEQSSAADVSGPEIPIRNLWLLMLYASDLYRHGGVANVAVEENPDDIPDLVARLLADLVERRLRRNLSVGYVPRERTLDRVRGRIDVLSTARGMLLARGKIHCRFEELTLDTPRNRYIRAALQAISRQILVPELRHRCRAIARTLGTMGVSSDRPADAEVIFGHCGWHDTEDAPLLAAARLAFDLALPTEDAGTRSLLSPAQYDVWLRKLYEKAVAGFYRVALGPSWNVRPGRLMQWPLEWSTAGIDSILPSMKTDVTLDHPANGRRLIIDTKFNRPLVHGAYSNETLRSGYIYQIYAYVRAQEGTADPLAAGATGILLHPSVGFDLYERASIHGHEFRFVTVNLADSAVAIRKRLLEAIEAEAYAA